MRSDYGELECMPPGYRFIPTDEELIFYLRNKVLVRSVPGDAVKDIDVELLYSYPPNEIVEDPRGGMGEWYFFIHHDMYRKRHREKENIPMVVNGFEISFIKGRAFLERKKNVSRKELQEKQQNEDSQTFTNCVGKDSEEEQENRNIQVNENRIGKKNQQEEQDKEKVRIVGNGIGFWKSIGKKYPIYDASGNLFAFKIYFRYFSGSIKEGKGTHWRLEEYHLVVDEQGSLKEECVLGRITRGKDYSLFSAF